MGKDTRLRLAVVFSLVAGILILCQGLVMIPYQWTIGYWVYGRYVCGLVSFAICLMIVSGALITVSAAFLYKNPQHHTIFGLIILLASPLCLLALGIASPRDHVPPVVIAIILMFLGMIGGAQGITYKHEEK